MVYAIQKHAGKNLLPATKYGEIDYLLPEGTQVGFSSGAITNRLMGKLSNFNDNDYLLLIGDPVAIGIATAVAAHWNQGKVKMLKWDKMEMVYYPIQIELFSKKGEKENELT